MIALPLPIPPSLSQPKSCYPTPTLVRGQETASDMVRFWPEDPSVLGLTELGKRILDLHLSLAYRMGSCTRGKRKIEYSSPDKKIQTIATLPATFFTQRTSENTEFYLLTNVCFAKGGSRTLKMVYNLTTGKFFVKKRLPNIHEETVIQCLQKKRAERGITNAIIFRTVDLSDGSKKLQVIEPIRDGTVNTLFGTEPFAHFSTRLGLVLDLLHDLNNLHKIRWDDAACILTKGTEDESDERVRVTIKEVPGFHVDIKLDNTLVFHEGSWRAVLCDFEKALNPQGSIYSFGYTPPDYIELYKKILPGGITDPYRKITDKVELINYNLRFAQARDVWSMGLVLLAIITGKTGTLRWTDKESVSHSADLLPPLPSLHAALSYHESYTWAEEGILTLTQEQIDKDLDSLQAELLAAFPKENKSIEVLFSAIRGMLKINPRHRIAVARTLAYIEENLPVAGSLSHSA